MSSSDKELQELLWQLSICHQLELERIIKIQEFEKEVVSWDYGKAVLVKKQEEVKKGLLDKVGGRIKYIVYRHVKFVADMTFNILISPFYHMTVWTTT